MNQPDYRPMLCKTKAERLYLMLQSGLIYCDHYIPFCDNVIKDEDNPPGWILELATVTYIPDALNIIGTYVWSEPFIQFEQSADFYIACLFLRYQQRHISWRTFLEQAGHYSDAYQEGYYDCSYYYGMTNQLVESEHNLHCEEIQVQEIAHQFATVIACAREIYHDFVLWFRAGKSQNMTGPSHV
ncbi:hypothetical protein CHU32_03835 [Superficieibacter electus]|uniref:Uncharacterized protein n=1 Tax=Superficieibacter electus TaxID=2022662 RepID=A0A2P5GVL3_9ENTR|nr:hypothetical protein [Superficieibacter electus]POP42374.1 hypothetical protein CHU33_20120 [Superficieibacter electus]POP50563.1 hypothetical protein CHU32_03835 [Superficieibacter electus]